MDENTQQSDRVSVGIEQDTTAVSFDGRGNTTTAQAGDSLNQSFDRNGEALTPEELAALEAEDDDAAGDTGTPSQEQTPEEGEGSEEGDPEETPEGDDVELPEWNGEDEAVTTAYDTKYITQDGEGKDVLNFEAFNAEFAKDRGEGKRDLNPGTRQYLKDRFGISDKLIDSHLAGVIAQEKVASDTFYSQFAAPRKKASRSTPRCSAGPRRPTRLSRKDRYNAAMKAGGEAALEQIELLKTRFLTKNPGKLGSEAKRSGIGLKRDRAVSPKANATGGQTSKASAAQPFTNAEEHRKAQNEALKLTGKDRDAKLADVRKRLEASSFWRA